MNAKELKRTTMKADEVIKSSAKLSGAVLVDRILHFIQGYITARFLGPHTFGVFSILGMVNTYASFAHFGLTDAASRELPYLLGRHRTENVQRVRNNAFTVHILNAVLVAGAIWIAGYWYHDPVIRWSLQITAVTIFFSRVKSLYSLLAYVYSKFGIIARCNVWGTVISFIFVATTIHWLKLFSVILVLLIAELWTIFYFRRSINLDFVFKIEWSEVWRLAKIGIWLVLCTVSYYVFNLTDRTMVAGMLGVDAVGYYSLAFFFFNVLHQFVSTGVNVIQPQLYRRLGEVESVREIKNYMIKPSLLAAYISSFVAGLIWILSPWFIKVFLPNYLPAIQSTQILIASLFFVAVAKMPQQLLPAPRIDRQKHVVGAYFIGVIANVGLNWFFIKRLNFGIEGAAWGTLIASGLVCVFLFALTHKFYLHNLSEAVRFYLELLIPIIWMMVLIIGCGTFWKGDPVNWLVVIPRTAMYLIGFLPCLWYFNYRTELISLFISALIGIVKKKRVQITE